MLSSISVSTKQVINEIVMQNRHNVIYIYILLNISLSLIYHILIYIT